jgi:hypothetical protein
LGVVSIYAKYPANASLDTEGLSTAGQYCFGGSDRGGQSGYSSVYLVA